MDGTLRILLVLVAASVPAALLHELGRAAVALLLTRGRVCVLLGSGRPLFGVRIGRLLVAPTARWLWGGECLHGADTSTRRSTAILLAGPLLFAFALVALARASADLVRAHGHRPASALPAAAVA
jgi:hypothetical protein